MPLSALRVSGLILIATAILACAEEPTSFTGSSTASGVGPGPTTGSGAGSGSGGGARGDGGDASSGDGGDSTSGAPDTSSSGDGGESTAASVGSGGAPPQTVDFDLTLDDPAPDVDLFDSVDLTLTIAENGYAGSVLLHIDELPDDVIAILDQTSVTLDGVGTTTVGLSLQTATDTVSGDLDFTITGTAEEGSSSVIGVLVVHPTLTILIPEDLQSYDGQNDAFGDFPTMISQPPGGISAANPVTIHFLNGDNDDREIHADNPDQGFGHTQMPIAPGTLDTTPRDVNTAGTYNYYSHDFGTGIPGRIIIQ